jgi:hypothetical protein
MKLPLLNRSKRFAVAAGRVGLVVGLALAFLLTTIPWAPADAASLCSMPCCAGTAEHPTSGASGVCHSRRRPGSSTSAGHKLNSHAEAEPLCGLHRVKGKYSTVRLLQASARTPNADDAKTNSPSSNRSAFALVRPCQSDCAACACASNGRNAQGSFSISITRIAEAPTSGGQVETPFDPSATLDAARRQSNPRAPPVSL